MVIKLLTQEGRKGVRIIRSAGPFNTIFERLINGEGGDETSRRFFPGFGKTQFFPGTNIFISSKKNRYSNIFGHLR